VFLDNPFPLPPVSIPTLFPTFVPRRECPLESCKCHILSVTRHHTLTINYRVKPVAAVVAIGYGAKLSLEMAQRRHIAQMEAMERENAAYRERNEALMNMYGDRSSLDELEKAVQYYEKR